MAIDRSIRGKDGKLDGSLPLGGKTPPTPQAGLPGGSNATVQVSSGERINATWLKYNRMPKSWTDYNSRIFEKHRAVAIRDNEGRNFHPHCADDRSITLESWDPSNAMPVSIIVPSEEATLAQKRGLTCAHCGEYIVKPVPASGLSEAEIEFRRLNDAYLEGKITKSEWLAGVKTWAEHPESTKDIVEEPKPILSAYDQLEAFKNQVNAFILEYEEGGDHEETLLLNLNWLYYNEEPSQSQEVKTLNNLISELIDRYVLDIDMTFEDFLEMVRNIIPR